jgi:peptidase MA superfamily protein
VKRIALIVASGAASIVVVASDAAIAAPRLEIAAHSGRVTVLAEPGLEGTAEKLANSAEATLARIRGDLPNLPQPPAIEVHLVRDAADLAAVAPAGRGAPSWAIGVAYPDLGVICVAMRRGADVADPETTLRHELGHIALGAALGDRAPHWLHEGFAYQHSAEWSWARAETLAGMAWFNSIIPLAELDRSFPAEELPANRAYAESYDFVGFLSRRGRWADSEDDGDRQPFRRFLDEIGRGADLDTAAIHAFGRPLKALFDEWRDDLNSRYKFMPIGLLGIGLWVLVSLLVVLAWWKRKRQNRRRIAQWDLEDAARRERADAERANAPAQVIAPPYIPWPGEDPLDEPDDDERPDGPRWMN